MAQYEMNLRDYWLIIRRRKFIIIGSTVLVALFSFWFARQKVPVYEATAAVKFEQSTALSGLMVEVLSYSSADSIETQASLIRSYPILEEVARRMGKLPDAVRGGAVRESKSYMAALDAIAAKIRTNRIPSTSILEIVVTSPSAREARDLANTVAEAYRDYNRAVRNARITEARKFIEAQLKEVEGRVRRAEEEVWAFREANRIISPGAESTVLLSLFTQLRGDIERARQQRTELEMAQSRLGRSETTSLGERVFVDSANPALQRLQATQMELTLERNNLALEVTERHPRLQALDDRLREVRAEMRREVTAQISLLRSREDILNRQMADLLQKNREVPAIELGLQRLQRDAKVNDDLLTLLKTKHQEALIKESEGIEEVSLVRPATEPTAPIGGEMLNTLMVGALLGLLLGLVLAFVQETLDTSIGTIEDVETYLQVPVLGVVPHIDSHEAMRRLIERRPALAEMDPEALQSHALLVTHFDPKSPVAEAYRTLRTNVQFMRMERQAKLLVVTSPTLQEGKTTTIVNLALTMAQNGQRTLLVGANLRRPSIHRFFGIEREPGLSNILVGSARWRDCIRTVADILMGRFEMEDIMAAPGLDNLHIIESGPIPANPSELLSQPSMAQFLREVRDEYDIVLIDTPPVLPVTDSAIVAAQVDGVVLVYQAGKVGRLVLKRAKAHLDTAHGKVWGVVLNDVQAEIAGYAYTHYYTHYYGEETATEERPGRVGRLVSDIRARLGAWVTATRGAAERAATARWAAKPRAAEPPATGATEPPAARAADVKATGSPQQSATDAVEPAAIWAPASSASGATRPSETDATEAIIAPAAAPKRRRPWYRNLIGGALLLVILIGALGVMLWQAGWVRDDLRPREMLRKRLDSPPPAPPRRPDPPLPSPGVFAPTAPTPLVPPPTPIGPSVTVTPPTPAPVAPPVTVAPSPRPAVSEGPPRTPAPAPIPSAPTAPAPAPAPILAVPKPSPTPPAPAPSAPPTVRPSPPPPASSAPATVRPTPRAPASSAPATVRPSTPPPASSAPTTARPTPPPAERFAVEFGPFATANEAEQVERRLNQAGHQTVRFRQQTGAALYAVIIERVPSARDAQQLAATLREQGFGDAKVLPGAGDAVNVRVGEPLPLRGAVQLAERLRARGQPVRIAVQPGEAVSVVIRHGNFASRGEAEERAAELAQLGVPNHVVRVK